MFHIASFNKNILMVQLKSVKTRSISLTSSTSIEFHSHGDVTSPTPREDFDKSSIHCRIESLYFDAVLIIVATESLERNHVTYLRKDANKINWFCVLGFYNFSLLFLRENAAKSFDIKLECLKQKLVECFLPKIKKNNKKIAWNNFFVIKHVIWL